MVRIVWELLVRKGCGAEFERHYSASGTWAALFRRSRAYRGTTERETRLGAFEIR